MTPVSFAARLLACVALALAVAPLAAAAGFVDVLNEPAALSALASKSLLQAITRAGDRLIAVGQRGHIVVSVDGGANWKQAVVPVSSDLTAVYFADAQHGWAVGHDGVVLHSETRGDTWELQLDGRKANKLLVAAMERAAAADPASGKVKKLLAEARRYREQGPDKPFLDLWFEDAHRGYVVGAYNLIFRTTDGGRNWEPWFDRTENPRLFNLYAIRPAGAALYIAGEGGLVMKLDPAAQRFKALTVPYQGSLFGVTAMQSSVLVFGLRGNVFRSDDAGDTWTKVDAGLPASVVAAATTARNGELLADAGGRIVASLDGGRTFQPVALKPSLRLTGLVDAGGGRLALVGPRGIVLAQASTAKEIAP
jgi:photosystem II stability/assembly factor-like uncharacterized protein